MQSKPINEYILFGTELRFLQDAGSGWIVHRDGAILDNIERFFTNLNNFDLPVTRRACNELLKFKEKIEKTPPDHKLIKNEASSLRKIMLDIRNTLLAETGGKVAYIVTDKRIDIDKLISDVPALLAPSVYEQLPDIAQHDFMEAGKCIAFERSTAGAFHLLRGTEGVLRHFYCAIVRRKRVTLLWGPMVQSLKKRRKPPSSPLLDNLDNIRRSFRNPTQHPDKIYDIQEVQDLFGLCIDIINRMVLSDEWQSQQSVCVETDETH